MVAPACLDGGSADPDLAEQRPIDLRLLVVADPLRGVPDVSVGDSEHRRRSVDDSLLHRRPGTVGPTRVSRLQCQGGVRGSVGLGVAVAEYVLLVDGGTPEQLVVVRGSAGVVGKPPAGGDLNSAEGIVEAR